MSAQNYQFISRQDEGEFQPRLNIVAHMTEGEARVQAQEFAQVYGKNVDLFLHDPQFIDSFSPTRTLSDD